MQINGTAVVEAVHAQRPDVAMRAIGLLPDGRTSTIATSLADGRVTGSDGGTRTLRPDDIMVVAPYNMAVARIRSAVPEGVRVGTVDMFQGREAPVVFYALTCSTGEDVPRGLDFLFSRNRMNVAISRAQCIAVVVHAPRLLDADCRTLEQMALVDGACRLVELAQPIAPA